MQVATLQLPSQQELLSPGSLEEGPDSSAEQLHALVVAGTRTLQKKRGCPRKAERPGAGLGNGRSAGQDTGHSPEATGNFSLQASCCAIPAFRCHPYPYAGSTSSLWSTMPYQQSNKTGKIRERLWQGQGTGHSSEQRFRQS